MAKKRDVEKRRDVVAPMSDVENRAAIARPQRPAFCPDLVPIFMMIETELFRVVNETAARRNVSYDGLIRMIVRERLCQYE